MLLDVALVDKDFGWQGCLRQDTLRVSDIDVGNNSEHGVFMIWQEINGMVDGICLDGVKVGLKGCIITVSNWDGEVLKIIGSEWTADDKIDGNSSGF